ncbi:HAMP domain-containing histidine kinase [Halorarum halophilum]|uniref:histidine kinase n=1 Tax=Halorarum halophilum TaxID=2743090 RepID=A0A7D5GMG1_9EURY|nr:HAMP domain-containing sensor histidine kinase [Halobaculum halophilum]QLG28624.1 HAMP domain-containing histidine kinase [Halobaculum halophilum]
MDRLRNVLGPAEERIPRYVLALGALLTLLLVGEFLSLLVRGTDEVYQPEFLIGVVSAVPFIVGITYGGYWLRRSTLSPDRYPRIGRWCAGGLVVFLLINLALIAVMGGGSLPLVVGWIRWAVSLGAGVGLLVGIVEARAIQEALAAERAALRAENLESQRDLLDYLNSILRHEVLNSAAIIGGYASLLQEEHDEDEQEWRYARTIDRQAADMTKVIRDVRVLLSTTSGGENLERMDLARVLRDEVRKLHDRYRVVEVETSIPDDAAVAADDLLPRVFANVLSNAVEHNDATTPRVTVTVEPGPETVVVEIADNGPGIPEEDVDTLFDRTEATGGTHGMGLYLVGRILDRYDGSIELASTGADGSTFVIELPRASEESDGHHPAEGTAPSLPNERSERG